MTLPVKLYIIVSYQSNPKYSIVWHVNHTLFCYNNHPKQTNLHSCSHVKYYMIQHHRSFQH